ncbi:MAG: box helicase domain protein [Myxococcaceae bacterium]|nr:box helicase domain protein [Myxococcaceae bacterium]
MPLSSFHPAVARWFTDTLGEPTTPQRDAWPAIARGEHALIAAPTGSGKTLAAFLAAIDRLVREGVAGGLPDETRVLYISPLRALSHDVEKNLQLPLAGVAAALAALGLPAPSIRTWVRTGDTTAKARAQARARSPHIVVTTPESLYVLLTSDSGRQMLGTVRTVIVDEIHALVRDKRGSHLALSLERLERLVSAHGRSLQRIGLSATQNPIDEVARFLVGARDADCHIFDSGHRRTLDLALLLPDSALEAVMSNEVWSEVYDKLVRLIESHRTTLVFVNTRRTAERVARRLSEQLGEQHVTSHHGSLSREKRLAAEQRLKAGQLKVLVATASLELGIDIGDVDLVCQVGSPRSIAGFLQRVGRSGHSLRGVPKGRLVPLSRDDLVECTALLHALREGELDRVRIPVAPLDVLAQQIVAASSAEDCGLDELYRAFVCAAPYRALRREDFDAVVSMLADGFSTRRGRRAALVHHDAVNGRLRGRRGARLTALTSGGAIPDSFDYEVLLEPDNVPVGTVHEDFAIESMAGEIFQLGNASYRIRKAEPGLLRVEDARGLPPSLPFWIAEAPGRTDELSRAVSSLRARADGWLAQGLPQAVEAATALLHLEPAAAEQLIEYLSATRCALGCLPTHDKLVIERFFDETDSMHIVLHAPFGTRVNRAFGLALRKRFCRSFNVELQAAATDDGILLSLGPMHSFALEDVFGFLRSARVRDVLIQALLDAPLFGVRFRWNATRALAISRMRAGKKVPPRFQRMAADDLLAVVFPDQVACAENLAGEREVPDHPLVRQTIDDCLNEAMDIGGLERLLARIERGEVACIARDLSEPSPLAYEILNARPYAFLDDAPLEERRTQAVVQRRWLDPSAARELGALDAVALQRVVDDCALDPRDPDELHDALLLHAAVPAQDGVAAGFEPLLARLVREGRATQLVHGATTLWIAAERVALWQLVAPTAALHPPIAQPASVPLSCSTREDALREAVRGRLEAVGPTTARELAGALGLHEDDVGLALSLLEAEGFVLRGHFRAQERELEWCERRLLSRIHRATLEKLRSEIEPVSPAVLMRFLTEHQSLAPSQQKRGAEGLYAVIEQLSGFEIAASAWEEHVLPRRVADFQRGLLDQLSFTGRVAWARAAVLRDGRASGPIGTTPIALFVREQLGCLRGPRPESVELSLSAHKVQAQLRARGASFVSDLARATSLERGEIEDALGELSAQGLVTSDGFLGLRALIMPASESKPHGKGFEAGRYALIESEVGATPTRDLELTAQTLLRRWGVLFRRLAERESTGIPWRALVRVLRDLEARGEIRGGRFVSGFSGEQFALPEAVSQLRRLRREPACGELISICASDPLNLVGVITPGPRIPQLPSSRILLRDGLPIAALLGGACRWLVEPLECERAELEGVLRDGLVESRPRRDSSLTSSTVSA